MTCCLLSKGVKMWCAAFIQSFPFWGEGIVVAGSSLLLPISTWSFYKIVYWKIIDIHCSIRFKSSYFVIGSSLIGI